MKILIIFPLLFLLLNFNKERRSLVVIKNDIFTIEYSEIYEQPLKVVYWIKCAKGNFSRKGLDFYEVAGLITSNDEDYKDNDYDKGHMAPAGDFSCDLKTLNETFSYANCSLQHKNLNRGVWKILEEHERLLANQTKVKVTIKIVFDKTSKKLLTGATIPNGFFKIIEYQGNKETYYFPNTDPLYKDYKKYKIKS